MKKLYSSGGYSDSVRTAKVKNPTEKVLRWKGEFYSVTTPSDMRIMRSA